MKTPRLNTQDYAPAVVPRADAGFLELDKEPARYQWAVELLRLTFPQAEIRLNYGDWDKTIRCALLFSDDRGWALSLCSIGWERDVTDQPGIVIGFIKGVKDQLGDVPA